MESNNLIHHQQTLTRLCFDFREMLSEGFSIQYIVNQHYDIIINFVRSNLVNKSGPYTLEKFCELTELNLFAVKKAIQRYRKKQKENNVIKNQQNKKVNMDLEAINKNSHEPMNISNIFNATNLNSETISIIKESKEFSLDTGKGIFKLIFKDKINDEIIFDAYAKNGQSKIAQIKRFNTHINTFI
ncbi:hypothetical protein [Thiomicrospira microaerophila]|uniref:hypothetical protein n=1 Tax=Thiomicrospira microaerophila TaxID=406020 RepID=UPI0005C89069|nr:hypothetical protein [Thiomicrospira microaerophila]